MHALSGIHIHISSMFQVTFILIKIKNFQVWHWLYVPVSLSVSVFILTLTLIFTERERTVDEDVAYAMEAWHGRWAGHGWCMSLSTYNNSSLSLSQISCVDLSRFFIKDKQWGLRSHFANLQAKSFWIVTNFWVPSSLAAENKRRRKWNNTPEHALLI